MSGQWYLVYRYRWAGTVMVRDDNPIDGVYASHADAAVQIAAERNDYKNDYRLSAIFGRSLELNAVFCTTAPQRQLASELEGRHAEWWLPSDFVSWMKEPAYTKANEHGTDSTDYR